MKRQTIRLKVPKAKESTIKVQETKTRATASSNNGGTITLMGKRA